MCYGWIRFRPDRVSPARADPGGPVQLTCVGGLGDVVAYNAQLSALAVETLTVQD
jgi:hypothetical protein